MNILPLELNIPVNIHHKDLNFTHNYWKVSTTE